MTSDSLKTEYDVNRLPETLKIKRDAFDRLRSVLMINKNVLGNLLDEPLCAMLATVDMIDNERARCILACVKEALNNAQDLIEADCDAALRYCDKLVFRYLF